MWNAGLEEAQAGIKIAGRNTSNLRYADDTTLMAESEELLKSLLMKVKEESEKAGLKLSIQVMNIMASGPINSWQIDGETVTDYIFLGSKITADGDCSHEVKSKFVNFCWAAKRTAHVIAGVRHDLVTKPPPLHKSKQSHLLEYSFGFFSQWLIQRRYLENVELCWFQISCLKLHLTFLLREIESLPYGTNHFSKTF